MESKLDPLADSRTSPACNKLRAFLLGPVSMFGGAFQMTIRSSELCCTMASYGG